MKGLVCAGGTGSRLRPLTEAVNKHLLGIYDRPMIYYPLERMREAVAECAIVANKDQVSQFHELLGDEFRGMKLSYAVQQETGKGIADAIASGEHFAEGDDLYVILGDNIFLDRLDGVITEDKAHIFVKEVAQPELNGVVEFDDDGNVRSIEEKPKEPKSNFIQLGAYLYPPDCFDRIRELEPSFRGEIEVADLNQSYVNDFSLTSSVYEGEWHDAGTSFDHLLNANIAASKR